MGIGFQDTLINSQADSTAITAAAATSCLPTPAKKTLLPNYFDYVGKAIIIEAWGRLSVVVTSPGTLRFDIRFGAILVFDSLAVALVTTNAYTNVGWYLRIMLTARVIGGGTSAQLMGQGMLTAPNILGGANVAMPIGGVNAMLPWNTAPVNGNGFDSTVSQQVDMFFTQTVATGSMICHQFAIYGIN